MRYRHCERSTEREIVLRSTHRHDQIMIAFTHDLTSPTEGDTYEENPAL